MNKELQQYILDRVVVNLSTDCWNWVQSKNKVGYGSTGHSKWYKKYGKQRSHQLSYIAFKGEYPKELYILHSCNNPSCCNPEHLRTGTHKDNMKDRELAGNSNQGEKHPRAKLTSSDVKYIRTLLTTMKQKDIAAMFGVAENTVSQIKTGKRWGN